jgi:hypothetical protein
MAVGAFAESGCCIGIKRILLGGGHLLLELAQPSSNGQKLTVLDHASTLSASNASCAASCSAARLLEAMPRPRMSPATRTSTVNDLS